MLEQLCNTEDLKIQKQKLVADMNVTGKLIDDYISNGPKTMTSVKKGDYEELCTRLENNNNQLKEIEYQINQRDAKRFRINSFLRHLSERENIYTEFNDEDFLRLVDHMTVYGLNNIVVTFRGGIEQKA